MAALTPKHHDSRSERGPAPRSDCLVKICPIERQDRVGPVGQRGFAYSALGRELFSRKVDTREHRVVRGRVATDLNQKMIQAVGSKRMVTRHHSGGVVARLRYAQAPAFGPGLPPGTYVRRGAASGSAIA